MAEKLLNKFRLYLSIVRNMKYELTEEVQKVYINSIQVRLSLHFFACSV